MSGGEGTRAVVLERIQPRYPSRCRRRSHEGEVHLAVLVNTAGQAQEVSLVRSAGCERLDQAALEAVAQFRFRPARRNGLVISSTERIVVRFEA